VKNGHLLTTASFIHQQLVKISVLSGISFKRPFFSGPKGGRCTQVWQYLQIIWQPSKTHKATRLLVCAYLYIQPRKLKVFMTRSKYNIFFKKLQRKIAETRFSVDKHPILCLINILKAKSYFWKIKLYYRKTIYIYPTFPQRD
jgi:hypothetical protein